MKYYEIKRSSATGKKLCALEDRCHEAYRKQQALIKEINAETATQAQWVAYGGIATVQFSAEPDRKNWRELAYEHYVPAPGSAYESKVKELPTVAKTELNLCIGFISALDNIGINWSSTVYVGLVAEDKIPVTIDCKEVSLKRYKKTFNL